MEASAMNQNYFFYVCRFLLHFDIYINYCRLELVLCYPIIVLHLYYSHGYNLKVAFC